MSRPTAYQRVEATNDASGETWLVRQEFTNATKATDYFQTLTSGKQYSRVSLESWDKDGNHLGQRVWFKMGAAA